MTDDMPKISIFKTQQNAVMAFECVVSAVVMLDMFDWSEVRDRINRAHSVGHIIDPTGYKSLINSPTVDDNVKIADAVDTFLNRMRQIKAEAEQRVEERRG